MKILLILKEKICAFYKNKTFYNMKIQAIPMEVPAA